MGRQLVIKHLRWAVACLAGLVLFGASAASAPAAGDRGQAAGQAMRRFVAAQASAIPDYDVRRVGAARAKSAPAPRAKAAAVPAARRAAIAALRRSIGPRVVVNLSPITGTPNFVANRAGFLTGPQGGSPERIALRFVRDHQSLFGLDADDLANLRVVRRYTTKRGLTHIEWHQFAGGIPAFDTVVRANVVAGRLVNVSGAPEPDLAAPTSKPAVTAPRAAERALADVGVKRDVRKLSQRGSSKATVLSGGNLGELVLFVEAGRTRLAWSLIASAGRNAIYRTVVDASSGEVLKRASLVEHASGNVFPYYPGAASGGSQVSATFPTSGADPWLTGGFDRLAGDNTLTYSDQDDDLGYDCGFDCTELPGPSASNEVAPSSGSGTTAAAWTAAPVTDSDTSNFAGRNCPATGCTWNDYGYSGPFGPGSNWQRNRAQAGTQLFWDVNNFHDYLQADPGIAFDDVSGNFEQTASDPSAIGGDPVHAQVEDGAATDINGDFPDLAHSNNANMLTLPEQFVDGTEFPTPFRSPRMQMYLFSSWGVGGDITDVNGADDAAIVYHEYTHGLTQRLVDPFEVGGYGGPDQGGALSEAWSDWYALDYLNSQGLQPDTTADGDVVMGVYEGMAPGIRTQGIDCPVSGQASVTCFGGSTPHYGGYTYADFGGVIGFPEVHADGEIWGETLWQLRHAMIDAHGTANGIFRMRWLTTDAMRISPTNPSFLDMRDSMLAIGDLYGFGNADCRTMWQVFANRGMGAFALTTGADDVAPSADFVDPGSSESYCPPDRTLTVARAGRGSGTVTSSYGGINCGSSCVAVYADGADVTLHAAPAGDSRFVGWAGACTGSSPNCVVDMTANRSATAVFAPTRQPDVHIKRGSDLTFAGDNVWNLTGASQTKSAVAARGQTRTFNLRAQNDGQVADALLVKGCGSSSRFTARYLQGATDVTSRVVAGTYGTGSLAKGAFKALTLRITPTGSASIGTARTCYVTATSAGATARKDVARATVTVAAK